MAARSPLRVRRGLALRWGPWGRPCQTDFRASPRRSSQRRLSMLLPNQRKRRMFAHMSSRRRLKLRMAKLRRRLTRRLTDGTKVTMTTFKTLGWLLGMEGGVSLKAERRTRVRILIALILLVHVVGAIVAWFVAGHFAAPALQEKRELLTIFIHLLSLITLAVGFLILVVSTINEAFLRETHELTQRTTRAATHQFSTFLEHILWVCDNLSPSRFASKYVHLHLSLSTPVYGIAADLESAKRFLTYIEGWIAHFETLPRNNPEKPVWELAVWDAEANQGTFGGLAKGFPADPERIGFVRRFADQCRRIYDLKRTGRIDFKLFLTDQSDARLFFVSDSKSDTYGGMLVVFSPLTESSIEEKQWCLVGFSFNDVDGFRNISVFNQKLQTQDYADAPKDKADLLKEPERWLERQYGMLPGALDPPDAEAGAS